MAHISVHIDGTVLVQDMPSGRDCLMIELKKDLEGYSHYPVQRDTLFLHGNAAELRAFAQMILAALPIQIQELLEPGEVPTLPADYPTEAPSC